MAGVLLTNPQLVKACKALEHLENVDHVLASEGFDQMSRLLNHFMDTTNEMCKIIEPPDHVVASDVADEIDFDKFRTALRLYLREKATEERRSKADAETHNARLGPNYWCKEAFRTGEEATFEDIDELLARHGLESTNKFKTEEAVSEAYGCILEISEVEFSDSGNLGHIWQLLELELRREEIQKCTHYARLILATCGLAKEQNAKKRARNM